MIAELFKLCSSLCLCILWKFPADSHVLTHSHYKNQYVFTAFYYSDPKQFRLQMTSEVINRVKRQATT